MAQSPPDLREYETAFRCIMCPKYEIFLNNVLHSPTDMVTVKELLRAETPGKIYNRTHTTRLKTLNNRLLKLSLVRACRRPDSKTFSLILSSMVSTLDTIRTQAIERGYYPGSKGHSELSRMTSDLEKAAGLDCEHLGRRFPRSKTVQPDNYVDNGCKVAGLLAKRMRDFELGPDDIVQSYMTSYATFGVVLDQLAGLTSHVRRNGEKPYGGAAYAIFTYDCTGVTKNPHQQAVNLNKTNLYIQEGSLVLHTRKQFGEEPVYTLPNFLDQSSTIKDRLLEIMVAYNLFGMLQLWVDSDIRWDKITWAAFQNSMENFNEYFSLTQTNRVEMSVATYEALVLDLQRIGTTPMEEVSLSGSVDEATEQFKYNEMERKEALDWWGQQQESIEDTPWKDLFWILPAGALLVLLAR